MIDRLFAADRIVSHSDKQSTWTFNAQTVEVVQKAPVNSYYRKSFPLAAFAGLPVFIVCAVVLSLLVGQPVQNHTKELRSRILPVLAYHRNGRARH
jgi:hypothetical protein